MVTTYRPGRPNFVADWESVDRDTGHTIDWANVPDDGTYGVAGSGKRVIPAGTRMGDAGTNGRIYPRVLTTNPAKFLLATDAVEDTDGLHGHLNRQSYGVIRGGVIYENLLPGAAGAPAVIPAAEKTELQTAGVGTGFAFVQYRDSTV